MSDICLRIKQITSFTLFWTFSKNNLSNVFAQHLNMDYKGLLKLIKKYSLYLWIKGKTQDKNVLFLVPNSIYEMIFIYIINLIEIKQLNNSKLTNMFAHLRLQKMCKSLRKNLITYQKLASVHLLTRTAIIEESGFHSTNLNVPSETVSL